LENIVFGIVTGCIILLGSVGFAMVQKAENFINVAHGQMLLIGAYLALLFSQFFGFILGAVLAILLTGFIGMLINIWVLHPVKEKGPLILLFTSVGLSYLINGVVGAIAGKKLFSYDIPVLRDIVVGGRSLFTLYELSIVIIALLSALGLHLFLTRTGTGKAIRAVADNYDLARVRGINTQRTANYVWFIASSLAGLAGVFLGIIGSLHIEMGWNQILIILAATVLGGLGNLYGVILASIVMGLSMELGVLLLPSYYRTAIAFVIIIIVLLIKPEGLQGLWTKSSKRVA
jgi:branched-subunit amino acid ABC-type transport system permease component